MKTKEHSHLLPKVFIVVAIIVVLTIVIVWKLQVPTYLISNKNGYIVEVVGFDDKNELDSMEPQIWVQDAFMRIPDSILNSFFINNQLKLVIQDRKSFDKTASKFGKPDASKQVNGYTGIGEDGRSSNIYILARNYSGWKTSAFTICHEFGHYFDYSLDNISDSEEWAEIYEEEFSSSIMGRKQDELIEFMKHNEINNPRSEGDYLQIKKQNTPGEYFAQMFAYSCYKENEDYKEQAASCPKTFAFLDEVKRKGL